MKFSSVFFCTLVIYTYTDLRCEKVHMLCSAPLRGEKVHMLCSAPFSPTSVNRMLASPALLLTRKNIIGKLYSVVVG